MAANAEAQLVVTINKMNKKILIGVGIFVIVLAFFIVKPMLTGKVVAEGDVISISLSEISEKAKYYEAEGTKFFVVKDLRGNIKTAFDACDVCYSSRKGYRQEGNYMICNNCGNKYPISGLGTENLQGGGCWPGYLPSEIQGENLIIKKSDLEKGRYRF